MVRMSFNPKMSTGVPVAPVFKEYEGNGSSVRKSTVAVKMMIIGTMYQIESTSFVLAFFSLLPAKERKQRRNRLTSAKRRNELA